MAYFRKAKAKAKARTKRGYKRRTGGVKGLVAKMVKVQLHKAIENKEQSLVFPLTAFNSGATFTSDVIQIVPSIARGTSGGERTGDQITARYFNIMGHILVNQTANDYPRSNMICRLMIVIPKQYPNQVISATQIPNWLPYVLKQGANGVALDGTIESMYLKPNYDVITVLADRKFYLKSSVIYTTTPSFGGDYAANWGTKMFNITLKVKNKKLKYSDNGPTPTQATTFAPSLLLACSFMDGSAPTTLSTPISMAFTSTLSYEDA